MSFLFISLLSLLLLPTHSLDFKDYKVPVDTIKNVRLDWKSNPPARHFRTVIRRGVRKGVNFAGHYCIVQWGCGSPCQSWVIVDMRNGKIYDGISTSLGTKYFPDSRLIILDPINDSDPQLRQAFILPPSYYEWKKNTLHLLYGEPPDSARVKIWGD